MYPSVIAKQLKGQQHDLPNGLYLTGFIVGTDRRTRAGHLAGTDPHRHQHGDAGLAGTVSGCGSDGAWRFGRRGRDRRRGRRRFRRRRRLRRQRVGRGRRRWRRTLATGGRQEKDEQGKERTNEAGLRAYHVRLPQDG